ncbi:MAG TPA: DUF402 domain-containing protein [Thermomicrobiales bacterium]|nr:DUF402 domain-containing protein [Thermomicrobiales bacterium]
MTDRDPERPQLATAAWSSLLPGAELAIVKLAPDGSEAARYRGEVVDHCHDSWVLVRATWTNRTIEIGGLSFCPGDNLLEWFSRRHPFNAFAVYSPTNQLKGWYANVTHPARLDATQNPPVLFWHDLYLDLVGLPDGSFSIQDDDELLASRLADADPELHARIVRARSELIRRFEHLLPPFADLPVKIPSRVRHQQNVHAQ